ncbi:GDP-mannose 4,6-dehydratase [Paenibacillus sp. TAB 01]|uniref:GDP-mannose 4,6-dehydratase n=1 Tax=Paenibacillus sp. TAB 01 TaxID=3368988 RepID=UPI0037538E78
MKVSLITGINGFVGKHLGLLLKMNGHNVYGTSRQPFIEEMPYSDSQFNLSFNDKDEIKKLLIRLKPNFIFHLMAQSNVPKSWENPEETNFINVTKTKNLIEAIIELKSSTRIINIGSSEEYGYNRDWKMPIKETYDLFPQNPYGKSKAAVSKLIQQYVTEYDLDIIHMRPFNHIGPGQKLGFVVPDFANQIIQIEAGRRNPELKVGNLSSQRDFSDVRDIVKGYLLAAEKGRRGQIYNICSGSPIRIISLLEKLISFSTAKISYEVDSKLFRPNDIPEYFGDNSKLIEHTEWSPEWSIDDTLLDTMNYFRDLLKL